MVDVFCDTLGTTDPPLLTRCKAVFAVLSIRVVDFKFGLNPPVVTLLGLTVPVNLLVIYESFVNALFRLFAMTLDESRLPPTHFRGM
jgi:hypothetical protein